MATDHRVNSIALPVLEPWPSSRACQSRPRSRIARRRVAVLIAVHVLIVLHILHWLLAETTLAPVVLSNAMKTLELGQINPAFVLFGVIILSTLIFGRFFCGWACHMGALQDLAYWILRKLRMRPALFRTRLLPYLPLAFAFYMFIWPTCRRELILPLFERIWPEGIRFLGHVQPFPGFSTNWMSNDLWAGLPGVFIAIPFLLVCGVVTVYFLGARGFCTYACPYGGIFKPIERLAPVRITVNPDACDACGQCTAACTSNVDVLAELKEHESVVSSHCTRNLDCISVCPQQALTLAPARLPVQRRRGLSMRTHRSDPTIPEEIAILLSFAAVFFTMRGLYGAIPMLFALGLGLCAMVPGWKLIRLLRDHHVRLHGFQLKRNGRLQYAGIGFLAVCILVVIMIGHSALVRYHSWRAGLHDEAVTIARQTVFEQPHLIPDDMRTYAAAALVHYQRASAWYHGGIGLTDTPKNDVRAAWMHAVRGEYSQAEQTLQRALNRFPKEDALIADRARLILLDGRPGDAIMYLQQQFEQSPEARTTAQLLVTWLTQMDDYDQAIRVLSRYLQHKPDDALLRAWLGRLLLITGQIDDAHDQLSRAAAQLPHHPQIIRDLNRAIRLQDEMRRPQP